MLRPFGMRFNEVLRQSEWRTARGYEPVNPHTLRRYLQHKGCGKFSMNDLVSLLKSDFVPVYNPFKEYFEGLPKWDGITDYIGKFSEYVKAEHPEFFYTMLKKMLVRTILCGLEGKENRYVFVLYSKEQNIGKSTWIKFLAPLKNRYFSEGVLDGTKDSYLRMGQILIWSLEELASLNTLEINKLKHIISLSIIVERPPYEPGDIVVMRRTSFFGSTNRPEFLSDVTGNTRWLILKINDIDFKYSEEVDITQVWSQAYALYLQKFDCTLTQKESELQASINQEYEVTYAESDAVAAYLTRCRKDNPKTVFMTVRDILDYLHEQTTISVELGHSTVNPIKLSNYGVVKALTAGDFVRDRQYIKGKQYRGYYVIKTTPHIGAEQASLKLFEPQQPFNVSNEVDLGHGKPDEKREDDNTPDIYKGIEK
jgi:predicted P-loop ATPase